MICAEPSPITSRGVSRAALAAVRAEVARSQLRHCRFCARLCGANRLEGERGPCGAGAQTRYFSAQTEVGDELELIPTFAVALNGCDLRCRFCISLRDSWNGNAGREFEAERVAELALRALDRGARTVMLLGGEPTIHLPAALELAAALPDSARLVWKTNACGSAEARELLDGVFDVWVADFKFGNDECAERLARAPDYGRTVKANLLWAAEHTDLIVRHLLVPGHVECCWLPVAQWLTVALPSVKVSLRLEYWPASSGGTVAAELRRPLAEGECRRALEIARALKLNLVP